MSSAAAVMRVLNGASPLAKGSSPSEATRRFTLAAAFPSKPDGGDERGRLSNGEGGGGGGRYKSGGGMTSLGGLTGVISGVLSGCSSMACFPDTTLREKVETDYARGHLSATLVPQIRHQ